MRLTRLRRPVDQVAPRALAAHETVAVGTPPSTVDEVGDLLAAYRDRLVSAAPMLATLPEAEQRICVATMVDGWLGDDGLPPGDLRDRTLVTLVDDIAGFGPLERLLADRSITEIMVNAPNDVYLERAGVITPADIAFRDAAHVRFVIERLLLASGRRLDESSPMVDARLADGSRLNAVLPPVALHGPVLTIRRAAAFRRSVGALIEAGSLDGTMAAFLHAAVLGRCSILVTGGTGAGKTTLLAALAALVPVNQRIVTLEDVAELSIDHPHVVAQECRPSAGDGPEQVVLRDLVRNSLRMRPDRIVVGEVRGGEAADMIQAMNTGHEGSMATLHANSAHDGLGRLEALLAQVYPGLPIGTLRGWIATAIDIVVHCERTTDGRRNISVIAACEMADGAELAAIPLYRSRGTDGDFRACGEVPVGCLERMAMHGVRFPARLFAIAA